MKYKRINDITDLEKINPIPIDKYPGYFYFPDDHRIGCSLNGSIINTKTGNKLKGSFQQYKKFFYIHVTNGKDRSVYALHRILARTFVGRPSRHLDKKFKDLEVNHCDGNRLNNNPLNLEWVTGKENINHSHKTGLCVSDRKIVATHIYDGKKIEFTSVKSCAEYFNIARATLWKNLNSKNKHLFHVSDYVVSYADDLDLIKDLTFPKIAIGTGCSRKSVMIENRQTNKKNNISRIR